MKRIKIFYVIFMASKLTYVLALTNVETASQISDLESNKTLCKEAQCIMKCCPDDKYVTTTSMKGRDCSHFGNTSDFASVSKYFSNIFVEYPERSKLNFTEKAGIFETNHIFRTKSLTVSARYRLRLTEYPVLYLEKPNAYRWWKEIPNDQFCWDYTISQANKTPRLNFWVMFPKDQHEYQPITKLSVVFLSNAMLMTCVFLIMVMIVYVLLPELWNLSGKIFMMYVTCLFVAFLLLIILRWPPSPDALICRGLTFAIYYFFMASYCWMAVMSYEVWHSFRCYATDRPVHRRRECFQFLVYCLYGFGVPLIMTLSLAIVDYIDMRDIAWFITPKLVRNGCFLEGGEKFLYMYVPMLILMLCDWIFCLITGLTLLLTHRQRQSGAAETLSHTLRMHIDRFMVYLKLLIVTSLNWLLEAVTCLYPGFRLWLIGDFYIVFIGVTIFLIYVCRSQILLKLAKRWRSR